MKYKNVLVIGGSGKLGQAIISSEYFSSSLKPSSKLVDITKPKTIEKFFDNNEIDSIINCAALARMKDCEEDPIKAIKTNIIGTNNLVIEVIKKENKTKNKIRFVHISTDGVYPGKLGNYSERDATIPYNKYGWTKLGAECAVNLLSNFCIIRTSFFDPNNLKFDKSAVDAYSSKVTIDYLIKAIAVLLNNDFVGTINIGSKKKSDYDRYKFFKPSLKKCKFNDITRSVNFAMASDSSMDCTLWKKIKEKSKIYGKK